MDEFFRDLRHSVRALLRVPTFTISAVATLALGIGSNVAIFSVVNTVLLKSFDYSDPGRIVMFQNRFQSGGIGGTASPTEFQWWKTQTTDFGNVSAYSLFDVVNITGDDSPEQLQAMRVSADFFALCGGSALHGRLFNKTDDLPGTQKTAVLTDALWKRKFGGDPMVVGKSVTLNGERYEIVGVAAWSPKQAQISEMMLGNGDVTIEEAPDVYLPFQLDPNSTEHGHFFNVAGRVQPGVTLAEANAQLQASYQRYAEAWPDDVRGREGFRVEPLQQAIVGGVRNSLIILMFAVSFVLLIACANVANLLLARATTRKREIAIRVAVGADRGRIIRQLLTENLLLSVPAGVVGLICGYAGIRAILGLNPGNIPRIGADGSHVVLDWRIAAFTFALSILTALLSGLIPALRSSHADLRTTLNEKPVWRGKGLKPSTQALIVVAEIALAVVLLIGAGLLTRTFITIQKVDPGFDPHNVLTMQMSLAGTQFRDSATAARIVREGLRRISALPGVEAASTTDSLPLEPQGYLTFQVLGRPDESTSRGAAILTRVSAGYFQTFRIPLIRGRAFSESDENRPVAIVNESMAKEFWPNGDPLRDQIVLYKDTPRRIVGIARDVHQSQLTRTPLPQVYLPSTGRNDVAWVVRTAVTPMSLRSAIERELRQASAGLPVARVRTMEEILSFSTATPHFNAVLLLIFGSSAVLLAAIGIYGVMAYSVTQRAHEIGVRRALGAESSHIRNMVVFQGARLAIAGVVFGVAAAYGLSHLLSSYLFGVQPWDPAVFVVAPAVLVAVSVFAALFPAVRASRVDPMHILRSG
jgi:putative ABC transport system permease protein